MSDQLSSRLSTPHDRNWRSHSTADIAHFAASQRDSWVNHLGHVFNRSEVFVSAGRKDDGALQITLSSREAKSRVVLSYGYQEGSSVPVPKAAKGVFNGQSFAITGDAVSEDLCKLLPAAPSSGFHRAPK